ncbi:glycosyltransferase [Mongoliitalea daihaiensis]|uniref:glycosyltransferase n=1 Tax=Mongoliitalea daihaiensis TaxID=2782006 RepID=UPI001F2A342A|nr:glycosyltransferase [Mongoliitalea daihaiensis]UJP65177.1 glycosyltransferase [Mongoliitalea daihaiensis]
MMAFVALGIVGGLILQDVLLIVFLHVNFKSFDRSKKTTCSWPLVSILIPFRNEATNVPRIVASLESLDYPLDSLQIILGDDGSEDETGTLLQSWAVNFSHVNFFSLDKPADFTGNGKAWALQHLCTHAVGEYLLFTDADCNLPASWVKAMVGAAKDADAAMVTGVTHVEASNTFAVMQSLDWWLNLGMVKIVSDLGTNITSMGNNMLLRRSDYAQTGGFQQTYHSLTEDFEMSRCISRLGGKHIHLVSSDNLITTQLIPTFTGLLQQRKRWMRGAMGLPVYWKVLLGLQVLFFPAIVILVILSFWKGILLWLGKLLIQSLFLVFFASKTAQKIKIWHLCLFEIYYFFTAWCTIVYYFWPGKTVWKGRKYS